MIFELISSSGNAKYAKLKERDQVIEIPTIMFTRKELELRSWFIGDSGFNLSMNLPLNYFDGPQISSKEDLIFVGNFLMLKTLTPTIIRNHLVSLKNQISLSLNHVPKDNAAVVIQPTDSIEVLKQILEVISSYKVKHVAIANFLPLLTNPRDAVEFLGTVRSILSFDTILYLLSPVPHTCLPILAYAGIDVFNFGFPQIATRQSIYLTEYGGFPYNEIKEETCFCSACRKLNLSNKAQTEKLTDSEMLLLEDHNKNIFLKKLREIRQAIKKNDLRSYVEQTLYSNAFSAAALKLLDEFWSDDLTARTSTWLSSPIHHITSYSYYRPAIKEYQKRIRERYRINELKKIVVIFPCAARKPYSESKSHKLFLNTLQSIPYTKRGYIQELIITSPLGVIPRELELVYPAAHYDIPVTGHWDQEEKDIAVNQLVSVLSKVKNSNITIIAHVSNEYVELCQLAEKLLNITFIYTTGNDKPTSFRALTNLKEHLLLALKELPEIPYNQDLERLVPLADYQFGLGVGKTFFQSKLKIKSKPHFNPIIFMEGKQAGIIQESTGQLTLSESTGVKLATQRKYFITVDSDELKGSTVYAIGVLNADPAIRPSDAVIIFNSSGKLKAIGKAIVGGKDMVKMSKGPVAKITQKVKD
ncbi:MAG: DUF5591 domain-containing protein [Candidatus Heimdallarchaeota archaeon]|nr:DUF5591 domain-containing protein [Candidatus Heimdallarchaeota archaeon]